MDIKTIKFAIEVIVKPNFHFYDHIPEIGNEFWEEDFSDWRTDRLSLRLHDAEKRIACLFKHDRVTYIWENIQTLEEGTFNDSLELFDKLLNKYEECVPDNEVKRVGSRLLTYSDFGYSFDELVESLSPRFYPEHGDDQITSITGEKFKDVAYVSLYEKDGLNARLQMGPVVVDELVARANLSFEPKKQELPDNSLFIDLDCFNTAPFEQNQTPKKLLEKYIPHLIQTNQKMIELLTP